MNKLGLLSLLFAGASLTMVGCASNQTPETAQSSAPTTTQSDPSLAQSATTEVDAQGGVAVQADPTLQNAEPVQAAPMEDMPQAEQPVQ